MIFSFNWVDTVDKLKRELALGLNFLSFEDNFNCFTVRNKKIKAGQVGVITNKLETKPSKYVIVDQLGGSVVARTEDNPWTPRQIFLKNYGTEDVTVSIVFFK